ncbi:CorA family divalent cation transporter [Streptomyces sp. NBC_01443]|uniref:magnesium transporter CorA family protein n=1 Tax=Streptomyces sp. NBC_01443 TaxID=2903868 RepID=UPI00224FE07D|nr:CorA family divalent cation transporter [Streptomyces sp. NBC_01443]MCX4631011.1 CorA family divalent cation transporter [Streptomyces sp. NBC_01443]
MIVSVVSMPEGVARRTPVSEARERLAAARFLFVDAELPEEDTPGEQPVAHLLGLEAQDLEWLGRERESTRAEFLGDRAAFVVPAVEAGQVIHLHVVATERYLVTVHRGPAGVVESLISRFPHERPPDSVATLFLLLGEALETYRHAAVQALLEVEDLEDEMFRQREPEQLYRLARLRRTAALLHHTLLPYHQAADETITRRVLNPNFPQERQRLAREYQRTSRLVLTEIEALQEAARRGFATYSSLVSGEQNGVINRLAIVSTIFLPLSFLTGFFGMNFAYLTDELESGAIFWLLAVGLQVAFLVVALYVLHRTRIWRRLHDDEKIDDE